MTKLIKMDNIGDTAHVVLSMTGRIVGSNDQEGEEILETPDLKYSWA